MKKLISILLIMTTILSCLALVGCEWFGGEQTTATTTTTTAPPPVDPSTIEFKHGDNFTEEDIEFVRSLHGYTHMNPDAKIYSFPKIVNLINNGTGYLYLANVDIDNQSYICAYMDFSIQDNLNELMSDNIDISKYSWYKFYNTESIPNKIGDLNLAWGCHTYDATIIKNISDSIEHNHKFKFCNINKCSVKDFREIYEYMIFYYWEPVQEIHFVKDYWYSDIFFQGHTTNEGKSYLILKYGDSLLEDGSISGYLEQNKNKLGEYYDVLYPYFERVEELDYEFTTSDNISIISLIYGIPIDTIFDNLFK